MIYTSKSVFQKTLWYLGTAKIALVTTSIKQ